MLVTIIADASHCPDTKGAGYGFWIASGRGKLGGGGPLQGVSENSNVAEMKAVCNALFQAVKAGLVLEGDKVLLQTDCMGAIHGFSGSRELRIEGELKAKLVLDKIGGRLNLAFEFRHVKGHTTKRGARFVTNNLCDARAKEGLRKARAALRAA